MTRTLFLDANVLVNICKKKANRLQLMEVIEKYSFVSFSAFSLFIAELKCLSDCKSQKEVDAYQYELKQLKGIAQIIPFTDKTCEEAKKIAKNKDYEDACQITTALESGSNSFLTSDWELYQSYQNILHVAYVPKS